MIESAVPMARCAETWGVYTFPAKALPLPCDRLKFLTYLVFKPKESR